MRNYIQFIDDDGRDMLASDGYHKFDGRLSLLNIVTEACWRYESLKAIRTNISGYKIIKNRTIIYTDYKAFTR